MTDYQVTRWRELPSMVTARSGEETVKATLAARFQEAIDEAATAFTEREMAARVRLPVVHPSDPRQ